MSDQLPPKPILLRDFIRAEALKGTTPEKVVLMVRDLVAKDPSLISEEDFPLVEAEGTTTREDIDGPTFSAGRKS